LRGNRSGGPARVPKSDDRGIGVFGGVSSSPTDSSLIDLYADAGFEFIGLSEARPNDKFGIAGGYAHVSRHAQALDRDFRALWGRLGRRGVSRASSRPSMRCARAFLLRASSSRINSKHGDSA